MRGGGYSRAEVMYHAANPEPATTAAITTHLRSAHHGPRRATFRCRSASSRSVTCSKVRRFGSGDGRGLPAGGGVGTDTGGGVTAGPPGRRGPFFFLDMVPPGDAQPCLPGL